MRILYALTALVAVAALLLFGPDGAIALAGDSLALVGTPYLAGGLLVPSARSGLARGMLAVRADKTNGDPDIKDVIAKLNKAWEAFKAEHTEQLAEVRKGFDDVVKAEKVEKINAEITVLQGTIDKLNSSIAALQVGAGGGQQIDPNAVEHAKAFDRFFRKGVESGLRELEIKASLQTQSDPDGGYVVPEQMETTIDRVMSTISIVRSLARVIPISAGVYKKPINRGGATSGWVGETGARPETGTPQINELTFPAMELYAMPAATQTLLDDAAVNIEQWLADEISITFAEQEGDAFINGDGVNKPRGFLTYNTVANASYAWGKVGFIVTGAAADFAATNPADAVINLVYALRAGYRQNGQFLSNDLVTGSVRKFKDGQGDYLWQPSAQAGQPATFVGYAWQTDENMPDVGANAFPVAFADFMRAYLIVDRIGIRVLRDPYTAKPYVLFYTTKRVGGGIQNFEAIKLLKCSA